MFKGYFERHNTQFDYKQEETCSETFSRTAFFKTSKQKVTLHYQSIISEFINNNKNEKTVFLF